MDNKNKEKIGLVFSGGGAKGAYQIGVWQALNENGIEIDGISGASIGAFNACLFALGDIEKAKKIWLSLSLRKLAKVDYTFPLAILLNLILMVGNNLTGNESSNLEKRKPLPSYFRPDSPRFLRYNAAVGWFVMGIILVVEFLNTSTEHTVLAIATFSMLVSVFLVFPWLPFFVSRFAVGSHKSLEHLVDDSLDWDALGRSRIPISVAIAQEVETYSVIEDFMWKNAFEARKTEPFLSWVHYFGDEIVVPRELRKLSLSSGNVVIPTYPRINERPADIARLCVMASMALPLGIFKNVKIGKSRLMDGGVIDNTPAYPLLIQEYKSLIVVHLRPKSIFLRWASDDELILSNCVALEKMRLRVGFRRLIDLDTRVSGFPTKTVHIRPKKSLGFSIFGTLCFSKKKTQRLILQGYQDAKEIIGSSL